MDKQENIYIMGFTGLVVSGVAWLLVLTPN